MRGELRSRLTIVLLLTAIAATSLFVAPPAAASWREYQPETLAGGLGHGLATNLAMDPAAMTVHGDLVYFVDNQYNVIRRLDLVSGETEVIVGNADLPTDYDRWCRDFPQDALARESYVCRPDALVIDPVTGDLLFTEASFGTIRRVVAGETGISSASRVVTVAGRDPDGEELYLTGDGMQAKDVVINPVGLAVDRQGRIFFSEPWQDRVRMIDVEGRVWTVAGMRRITDSGYTSVGASPEGCLQEDANDYSRVCVPGTKALDQPMGLAFDSSGGLLIADKLNDRLMRLDVPSLPAELPGPGAHAAALLQEVATDAPLSGPTEIVVAPSGDLLISEPWDDRVVRVTASSHAVEYETERELENVGLAGDVLLVSENLCPDGECDDRTALFSVAPDDSLTLLAGNGRFKYGGDGAAAPGAQMNLVTDVVYDNNGRFYLVDSYNDVLRKVDCNGTITRDYELEHETREEWFGTQKIRRHVPITTDAQGNVYLRDFDNEAGVPRLVQLSPSGQATTLASPWPGTEMVTDQPDLYGDVSWIDVRGMLIDGVGRFWFTSDDQVFRYDPTAPEGKQYDVIAGNGSNGFEGDNGPAKLAELDGPQGLAMDAEGNLFIADTGNNRIRRWDVHSREITTVMGSNLNELLDRAAQADISHIDGEVKGEDMFLRRPADVAIDPVTEELWVVDSDRGRVLRLHRNRVTVPDGTTPAEGLTGDLGLTVEGYGVTTRVNFVKPGGLTGAQGIALADDGFVVADTDRDRAIAFTSGEGPVAECKTPPTEVSATTLSLTAPTQAQHTDSIDVSATLLDDAGAPVANETVLFAVGTSSTTAQTDDNGTATAILPVNDAPGDYRVTAQFNETPAYSGALAEVPLTVTKESTVITYVGDTAASSDQVRLAAQILDDDGAAVAGKTVTFTVAGQTFTATSDETGLAEVVVEIKKRGKSETVLSALGEDATHLGAQTTSTIDWTKKP